MLKTLIPVLFVAKTALAVCETWSYTTCADKTVHWYDVNNGQICDPAPCGGGRGGPAKGEHVPGCDGYTGTVVLTASYLSCFSDFAFPATTTADAAPTANAAPSSTEEAKVSSESKAPEPLPTEESKPAQTSTVIVSTTKSPTSTTVVVVTATTLITSPESTFSTTKAPAITAAASTPSESEPAVKPSETPNAGHLLKGSLMGAIGAVVAAVALA